LKRLAFLIPGAKACHTPVNTGLITNLLLPGKARWLHAVNHLQLQIAAAAVIFSFALLPAPGMSMIVDDVLYLGTACSLAVRKFNQRTFVTVTALQ